MAIEERSTPKCNEGSESPDFEGRTSVASVLKELQDRYLLVDQKLEQLVTMSQNDWNEELTGEILEQVNEIQQLSKQASALARVRETVTAVGDSFHGSAKATPTAISERIKTIETMFRDMLGKIALMERTVQEARDQLLPQVNAGVRALQVRRAYSGT